MWANTQRDGCPVEYRWRVLFNAAKFGWRPLLECRAVTLPRRETCWNLQGCPKLANRSQPLVGQSSPYYQDMWRRYCYLWSPYVIGQTIIFSSCFFFFLLLSSSFFSHLISAVGDWMFTILWHMVGLNANLECKSEMRCTRLAANTGRKKSPSRHHRTTLSGHIFTTKARIDNRKKTC